MQKILLYRPGFPNVDPKTPFLPELFTYPLGLICIVSKIKDMGFKISILDEILLEEFNDSLSAHLHDVSIVGMTGLLTQHKIMLQVAKMIKNHDPSIKIIFGGPNATLTHDFLLNHLNKSIDFIIQGEGEIPFHKLITNLDNNKELDAIHGLTYKKDGKIRINPPRLVEDLNDLPVPAFELSKIDTYYKIFKKKTKELTTTTRHPLFHVSIESSRGCPVSCNFCASIYLTGKKWRPKSPTRVIQEISLIEELFPQIIHEKDCCLSFVDNDFTTSRKRVREFCALKKKSHPEIKWVALSRATDINFELVKNMVDTGCDALYIGGESGNLKSLMIIGKKYGEDSVANAIKASLKAGLNRIVVSFIVGLPSENLDDLRNTLNFALSLFETAPETIQLSIFKAIPYPSTPFWNELESKHMIKEYDFEKYGSIITMDTALVFEHPLYGQEAKEINDLLSIWYKFHSILMKKLGYLNKKTSKYSLTKSINNFLSGLNSIDIKHSFPVLKIQDFNEKTAFKMIDEIREFILKPQLHEIQ